jgi:Xaa-Pro aminopeptidase
MTHTQFAARRARLLAQIGDGVAIIPTAPEQVRNRDTHFPYRFDSYFWYLTGFGEPEAVLVLQGAQGDQPARSVLFCRAKDEEREIWDGRRLGPAAAPAALGVDVAYPIDELDARLPDLLADRPALYHSLGHDADWDQRIAGALNRVRAMARAGKQAPGEIRDLRAPLDAMRRLKDDSEIATMRRAAVISGDAHRRAMRACRPGLYEYALDAEIIYELRRRGAQSPSYPSIVAGGGNACILHYVENDQLLKDGELVLIDAGGEVDGYAADITRTFPVNGRFSAAQREVYEIVLAAQYAAIAAIRPGADFNTPHDAALRVLVQGMLDLKLLEGSIDGVIESEAYKRFYMHRTGHWMGMDVHDVGDYKIGDNWRPLQPGMVFTVEPGCYIRPADDVPLALWNIGIRIEDDVAITELGNEVLTDAAPKAVVEIEELMRT